MLSDKAITLPLAVHMRAWGNDKSLSFCGCYNKVILIQQLDKGV